MNFKLTFSGIDLYYWVRPEFGRASATVVSVTNPRSLSASPRYGRRRNRHKRQVLVLRRGYENRFAVSFRVRNSACRYPLANAQRTITADVVALDQAFYNNRLGAFQASGMIFALRRDVVNNVGPADPNLSPGKVMLRPDKRPRPMVLRMNVGDCLQVNFQNLLAPVPSVGTGASQPFDPANLKTAPDPDPADSPNSQSASRLAGVHVMGWS